MRGSLNNLFRLFMLFMGLFLSAEVNSQQTIRQYLSGIDKDNAADWDFRISHGRKSGQWDKIPVPSNWEMQGFGTYNYFTDKVNPEETGFYKHMFKADVRYKDQRVFLVFDGVMTDAEVKVNGQLAGPVHQGGFYQFKMDITDKLHYDKENLLEVKVAKRSENASVNQAERKADFWLFGGIFRPVYLEIMPPVFIERIAVDANMQGQLKLQVYNNGTSSYQAEAQLFTMEGEKVGRSFTGAAAAETMLMQSYPSIIPWNPEKPKLYRLEVRIKKGKKIIHEVSQRIGFRTAELRLNDGFYVNGVKVIFKGVNRHSQWPASGRTLSREIHLMDIRLIKEMNMNAVRMSHYPPDAEFLDLCDSLGLFVLDELTGWQAAYDTTIARKLVKELVVRDVNHPSVVIWCNGNEGGWNRGVDKDYAKYDPQNRLVIHPWERFNGTNTKHYPDFQYLTEEVKNGKDVFFPTEFMHGLFDGGHAAALEDFWREMMKHPHAAGGFLWSLHDEGVVRDDENGRIDVAGNLAPDGIVGPYRQKEASFYAIRELWSPVQIPVKSLTFPFNGVLPVENHYLYSDLKDCRFRWAVVRYKDFTSAKNVLDTISGGFAPVVELAPGQKAKIDLGIGFGLQHGDLLMLSVIDGGGKEICNWSWPMKEASGIVNRMMRHGPPKKGNPIQASTVDGSYQVNCDGVLYRFNPVNGFLKDVIIASDTITFGEGPVVTNRKVTLREWKTNRAGDMLVLEPVYDAGDSMTIKWTFSTGEDPKMEYSYRIKGKVDYAGIIFNFPEEKIRGMRWLGRGPYRVWKNRLNGQQWGLWEKAYNNTITGESWEYPEFKGWHADVSWVRIKYDKGDFAMYTDAENSYFQMLQPARPVALPNENTYPLFPGNTIGFFRAISPIGTKFQAATLMGPQSEQENMNGDPVNGTIWFDFKTEKK